MPNHPDSGSVLNAVPPADAAGRGTSTDERKVDTPAAPSRGAATGDRRIDLVRSRHFFGHATGNMVNVLLGGLMISIVLSTSHVPESAMRIWGGLLVVSALIVALFDRKVARDGIKPGSHARQVQIRSLLGVGVCCFFGAAGYLLPNDGTTTLPDTFLFIIMTAVVTIASMSYSTVPRHYLLVDLVSIGPLTVLYGFRFATHGDTYYLTLMVLSVIWQTVVLLKALRVSTTVIQGIALNERLQQEIEDHMHTREAIRHLAMHDYLTGLANRRQFEETAERALKVCERDGARLGLLEIDLDDFKPVNDRHGHAVGDALLVAVAERLRGGLRASDFAARMGGDEFATLVQNVNAEADVHEVVGKLREGLSVPYVLQGHDIKVGASVGWALYPDDGTTLEALLAVADQRMYADKKLHKQHVLRA